MAKSAVKSTSASAKKKAPSAKSKTRSKRVSTSAPKVQRVDFYPNRMTVAVSVLAGTILVLVTIIAVLGSGE